MQGIFKKIKIEKKYLKYLPSKKFAVIIGICLIVGAGFLFIGQSKKEKFLAEGAKNETALQAGDFTLEELVQKDTDGDSIPDWEEALWGTDKFKKVTYEGLPDAQYIENRKKELEINSGNDPSLLADGPLTETDKFAREFFVAFTALKESGEVDQDTINNFSNALGQKIIDPAVIDSYLLKDVKMGSSTSKDIYYSGIVDTYDVFLQSGIGDELDLVSQMLGSYSTTGKTEGTDKLITIANAYQNFAKKIMEMGVPAGLEDAHLNVANSANNTGIAVRNMAKVVDDPVVGLSGLSQYQKYSADFIKSAEDLDATSANIPTANTPPNDIINTPDENL